MQVVTVIKPIVPSTLGVGAAAVYTAPVLTSASVKGFHLFNDSGSSVTVYGWYVPSGGAAVTSGKLLEITLVTKQSFHWEPPIALATGDSIQFQAGTGAVIACNGWVFEYQTVA